MVAAEPHGMDKMGNDERLGRGGIGGAHLISMRARWRKNVAHCDDCRCERIFTRRPFHHRRHAVVTALTGGLWLPVWLAALGYHRWQNPWLCAWCKQANRKVIRPRLAVAHEPALVTGMAYRA